MKKKVIDREKYFNRKDEIIEFLISNMDIYQDFFPLITSFVISDDFIDEEEANIPAALSQIYSKFDVYKKSCDPYIEFYNILNKYSFLEGNCAEICSGIYPRLSEVVIPSIDKNQGSLTIYDPNCMFPVSENITLLKEKFNKDTDIQQLDTLYALYPHNMTTTIVEKALEEDKNLVLGLCGCKHSNIKYRDYSNKSWAEGFCRYYQEMYGPDVEIIDWPSTIGIDLPIMVKRSTKHKEKYKSL